METCFEGEHRVPLLVHVLNGQGRAVNDEKCQVCLKGISDTLASSYVFRNAVRFSLDYIVYSKGSIKGEHICQSKWRK